MRTKKKYKKRGSNMKKNKVAVVLIVFIAILLVIYFIGTSLNATAEALTIIALGIVAMLSYLVIKAINSKK